MRYWAAVFKRFLPPSYHKGPTCLGNIPKIKKRDTFVLITSVEQCCLTAKDIKLNSILILQKWCQRLIFSLQVHWLINARERTVIIGWKWHQKLSKLWKGLPLNGFEPWIKKTINWEEAGVILTAQNKTNRGWWWGVSVFVLSGGGGGGCYLWTIPCHYQVKVYLADFLLFLYCCDVEYVLPYINHICLN